MCDYLKEITNNKNIAESEIDNYHMIKLACIYCVKIYDVTTKNKLYCYGNNICCPICKVDAVIPLISKCKLIKECKTLEEKLNKLKDLNYQLFKKVINDDEGYEDYEY
jgi:hypothetical protein|tara:strand:+ start:413 stop:736 length:324 start_codon:yes stop_codon:yes gene_type:complete